MIATAARRFPASAEQTLAVLGRVLRKRPYSLEFIETVGGHPLAGGTVRLALPAGTGLTGPGSFWMCLGSGSGARELSVALTPFGEDACEVRLTARARGERISRGAASELELVLRGLAIAVLADAAFAAI
jgi:hypothetical protein